MNTTNKENESDRFVVIIIITILVIVFVLIMIYAFYSTSEVDILKQVKDIKNSVRVNSPMIPLKDQGILFKLDK